MATRTETRKRRNKARRSRTLIVLAGLLGLMGIGVAALGLLGMGSSPTYVPAPTIDKPFDTNAPDTFTGAETLDTPLGPLELSVPAVGLRVSLVAGGIDAKGAMVLPTPDLAAWYTGAAEIGATAGSTVIAGHVNHSDASPAPMGLLSKIEKGTPIFVTDAAGVVHRYKAEDARLYAKHALPAQFFRTTGTPQLVLLTCGGEIGTLDGVLNYLDNAAITAVPWPY